MCGGNVILIGMPGAGKSTTGVLLAKSLKMPFTDTDLLIQQKENRFLQDIIDNDGISEFLTKEENVILRLRVKNHVIATGGSVVYSDAAMGQLRRSGTIVYLKLTFEEIQARISNITSRGIAANKGQSLLDLYNERLPLYEKYAGITVDCSGKSMEEVVSGIIQKLTATSK